MYILYSYVLITNLHNEYHVPKSIGSLVTARKLKDIFFFFAAAVLLFRIQEKHTWPEIVRFSKYITTQRVRT